MLELKNVSKFYYNKGVIASGFTKINLKLEIGEFVAITGESGSGKSTLLNVISGLDSYEEGEMYINGKETSHYSEKDFEDFRRKYISNIFQSFNLVNSYTVYQNIELVLLLNGYKKRKIKQKVINLIKKVDLYKFRNTKVSKLSGGQKQRVAIARALAKETPIILADEPTGNLDKESAESTIKLLSEIAKDKLVIIVTHNYEQIEKYVTRKITMNDGRIMEDKIIRKIETKLDNSKEVHYKNITKANRIRLGVRNTFNIKAKFILLFAVFLFITFAIMLQYANRKKQNYLAQTSGINIFFQDTSDNRIIINKNDRTVFTEEDYLQIEQLENVENIEKNDLLLDTQIQVSDGQNLYLYGSATDIGNFKGNLDLGRLPLNENEIIVEGYKDDYYIEQISENIGETTVYLDDIYTNTTDKTAKMKIVGIKYMERDIFYYNSIRMYLNDVMLDKIRFQMNQEFSNVKILFLEQYLEPYFRVKPNNNVPVGKAYVSRDLNYQTNNGNCINKKMQIEVENVYYKDTLEVTIDRTYTKNNFKKLLGLDNYEINNGTVYINSEDYNNLFNKGSYQSSIFVKNVEHIEQTSEQLQNLGYKTFIIRDTLVGNNNYPIMKIIQTIITIVLIVVLFFIAYFVIKIILKSRNTYFSTLRMLGANKKISKLLLVIELLVVENLAYILFIMLILLQMKNIINWTFVQVMLDYLKINDYIILYAILTVMSYLISIKYAKKLFKDTTIKTYNEEV